MSSSSSVASRKQSMPVLATASDLSSAVHDVEISGPMAVRKKHRRMSSWRRDIFQSVVTTPNSKNKKVSY